MRNCSSTIIWFNDRIVYPFVSTAPSPNSDMPENIISDYEEARSIINLSPKGAVALLRLCIQKLCLVLGESGKDINKDIGSLVKKGLSPTVQQALDIVRVIGNEAVHPGQIDLSDNSEIAYTLFGLINFIVEDRITRPKHIEQLYALLPEDKRKGIANRDT